MSRNQYFIQPQKKDVVKSRKYKNFQFAITKDKVIFSTTGDIHMSYIQDRFKKNPATGKVERTPLAKYFDDLMIVLEKAEATPNEPINELTDMTAEEEAATMLKMTCTLMTLPSTIVIDGLLREWLTAYEAFLKEKTDLLLAASNKPSTEEDVKKNVEHFQDMLDAERAKEILLNGE